MAVYLGSQFVDVTKRIEIDPLTGLIEGTIKSYENSGAESIGSFGFYSCTSLQSVDLPIASYIGENAFCCCYNLLSLYLGSTSVCSLAASSAFFSTPVAGYTTSTGGVYGSIYVPASLYSDYKTATNWTVYSSRFVAI